MQPVLEVRWARVNRCYAQVNEYQLSVDMLSHNTHKKKKELVLKVPAGNKLTKGGPLWRHQGAIYQAVKWLMSGRPRKCGWLIWECFPKSGAKDFTLWQYQVRCIHCTRSRRVKFAKRERHAHATAPLQMMGHGSDVVWLPLTWWCDCRGQTLN